MTKNLLFRDKEQLQKNAEDKEMVRSLLGVYQLLFPGRPQTYIDAVAIIILICNCVVLQGLLLDEQTGCLLKFSGELEDVSREDFHELFSGHGKIKWVDFTRGAKEVNHNLHRPPSLEARGEDT